MNLYTEINPVNGRTIMNLNGRWVTQPVLERLKALELRDSFILTSEWTFGTDKNGYPNVRIEWLDVKEGVSEKDVRHQTDYIRDHLRAWIGKGFTEILVNPAVNPLNGDNGGGIDTLLMIRDETGCECDFGSWLTPVKFLPESNLEYNEVMDLLNTFEMKYS